MKHMKVWLKSFSIMGLLGVLATNVVSCVDDGSQVSISLSVAKALKLVDATSANPLITLKHTSDTNWAVNLDNITLENLLEGTNESEPPKAGCESFISDTLKLKPTSSNLYSRSELKKLNDFTQVDDVTPVFAFNKDTNKYFLMGGFFTIQFEKNASTKLGDEYIIPLKTDLSFEVDKV